MIIFKSDPIIFLIDLRATISYSNQVLWMIESAVLEMLAYILYHKPLFRIFAEDISKNTYT